MNRTTVDSNQKNTVSIAAEKFNMTEKTLEVPPKKEINTMQIRIGNENVETPAGTSVISKNGEIKKAIIGKDGKIEKVLDETIVMLDPRIYKVITDYRKTRRERKGDKITVKVNSGGFEK